MKRPFIRLYFDLLMILLGTVFSLSTLHAGNKKTGSIVGTVKSNVKGVKINNVAPIVIYLDTIDKNSTHLFSTNRVKIKIYHINQKLAKFIPDFSVISVGDTVEFPNQDKISHNVFSYSKPNDFDLGIYPHGTSKSVTFNHPGIVRFYCSIHKSMNGVLFVTPTPLYIIADKDGNFEINFIPAGDYELKTWNTMLPEITKTIKISADNETVVSLVFEESNMSKK